MIDVAGIAKSVFFESGDASAMTRASKRVKREPQKLS